jgi:hypothetical protein
MGFNSLGEIENHDEHIIKPVASAPVLIRVKLNRSPCQSINQSEQHAIKARACYALSK